MQLSDTSTIFAQALSLHQKGFLDEALEHYISVYKQDSQNAECLHLIGVIALQKNHPFEAVELIQTAITLRPHESAYHCNLGNALFALEDYVEAIKSYSIAIELNANDLESMVRQGDALLKLGQHEKAIVSYEQALLLRPDLAYVHGNKAVCLEKLQQFEPALTALQKAIQLNPDYAEAYNNMGNVLLAMHHEQEAIEAFDRAIALQPQMAQAYSNRGNAYLQLKKPELAIESYNLAINLAPQYPEAFSNRGIAMQEMGLNVDAIASFNQAIALQPDYAQAFSNRSVAEMATRNYSKAIDSCNQAIQLDCNMADAYSNKGNAEKELKQLTSALASYQTALQLQPSLVSAQCNMGVVYKELQMLKESVACFDKAIALDPEYIDAYWNKALTLLLAGNYQEGWRLHEYRWKLNEFSSPLRNFAQPLWLGDSPIDGKTILLHSEQGLGDTIQFCRYIPEVAQLGAKVIVEVPAPLIPLLKTLNGNYEWVVQGHALPYFDVHCPFMSLPLAFGTTLENISTVNQYLYCTPEKLDFWSNKVVKKFSKTIGLVWQGSPLHNNDHNRSIELATLLKHLPSGFNYVCLQRDLNDRDEDLIKRKSEIQIFNKEILDFTDTAALCELMDTVITIDSSVAHLSGAIGKPTFVLLPYAPDWRWLLDRNDSPWYSSVRLYRQSNKWSWTEVLQAISNDLINRDIL